VYIEQGPMTTGLGMHGMGVATMQMLGSFLEKKSSIVLHEDSCYDDNTVIFLVSAKDASLRQRNKLVTAQDVT
jgi:hypothetical protein